MKNKIAAVSLAVLFALGAVACGGGGGDDGATEGGGGASEATS